MGSSLNIAKTGLVEGTKVMSTLASNMANAKVVAGKKSNYFINSLENVGVRSRGTAGVTGNLIQDIRQTGSATKVENKLYAAAGDKGFFVVDGGFTRVGTWKFDNSGYCVNHLGKQLQAYYVNPDGQRVDPMNINRLVSDKTSQASMRPINKFDLRMDAKASTALDFSYQLPSEGVKTGDVVESDLTVFDSFGAAHNLKFTFTNVALDHTNSTITPVGSTGPGDLIKATPGTASVWSLKIAADDPNFTNIVQGAYGTAKGMLLEFDSSGRPLNFDNSLLNGNSGTSTTVTKNKLPIYYAANGNIFATGANFDGTDGASNPVALGSVQDLSPTAIIQNMQGEPLLYKNGQSLYDANGHLLKSDGSRLFQSNKDILDNNGAILVAASANLADTTEEADSTALFDTNGQPLFDTVGLSYNNPRKLPPLLKFSWGNLAEDSVIVPDFGNIGENGGIVARGAQEKIGNITVNGNTDGQFSELQWDINGYGVVIYDNGRQEKRFQMAMAYFSDPDGLSYNSDGTYSQTVDSGEPFYGTPNDGNIGALTPSALEDSNISEIDTQVDIIDNQRYYMAQATVFKIAKEMTEALDQLR